MVWVLLCLGLVGCGILIMFLAGSLLPRETIVSRTLQLGKTREEVWKLITDFPGQTKWRSRIKRIEKIDSNKWREIYKGGREVILETKERREPELLLRELKGKDGIKGTWTVEIAKAADGCWVTVTEKGEIRNPFFRFVGRYIIRRASHVECYLRDLARHFGETPVIE